MYLLTDLHLFLRAADAGSLSAAARQLSMTPAAASASLKRLEQALEVRLFERSTRSLRLTPEGGVFREYCERALGVLADGEAQVRADRQAPAGTVHLAVPSDFARGTLSVWLDDFVRMYPQIRLVLHVGDAVHDLLRDTVDLAVRYGDLHDSRLVARRLSNVEQLVCASPAYLAAQGEPMEPADLADHNCLTFFVGGKPKTLWTLFRDGKPVRVKVSGDRSADDSSLVHQWSVDGVGVICKSALDVTPDLQAGRLKALFPGYQGEVVPLNAVYLGGKYLPLRVRTLLDYLIARFEELAMV